LLDVPSAQTVFQMTTSAGVLTGANGRLLDRRAREALLLAATQDTRLAPDVDLALLARTTTGMTDLELGRLCDKAACIAVAEGRGLTTMAHFSQALDALVLGGAHPALLEARDRSLAAYHEAGHAAVAWLTPLADLPAAYTILAHVRPNGAGELPPAGPPLTGDPAALLARLDLLLAGPIAEELATGETSEGGEVDNRLAAQLAGEIVERWESAAKPRESTTPRGGNGSLPETGTSPGAGEADMPGTGQDQPSSRLLEQRRAAVRNLLAQVQPALDALARRFEEEETLDTGILSSALGLRPGR
jgi:cell division protease FtsH